MRGVTVLVFAVLATGQGQPTFRSGTDLVRVDVLVERNGRPVAGLVADDFIVEDNGVRQNVRLVPAFDTVRVATAIDVSGSMNAEQLGYAASALRALAARLRAGDRHERFTFAGAVRRTEPGVDVSEAFLRSLGGGHTALFDALYAAVVHGGDETGPWVVAVVTDGHDNTSWLGAGAAIDAALRHEAVIYPVALGAGRGTVAGVPPFAADAGLRALDLMARRTGGRVVHADWSPDLGAVLGGIVDEYRQRYLLTFEPEGVPKGDGWHRLEVNLAGRRGTVHARRGYWSR